MLSNSFARFLTSVRPMLNYQQHFLRSLSTAEAVQNETSSTNREKGVVKRFSKEKGYGFISKTSDGTDYFVHFKNINGTGFKLLEQGQEVDFTVVQGDKGMEARDVNVVKSETSRNQFFDRFSNDDSASPKVGFGASLRNQSSSSKFNFGGARSSKFNFEQEDEDSQLTEKAFNFNTRSSSKDNSFSSRKPQFNSEQTRELGSIKRWTPERGFGFIRRTNGGPDLFCHVRSLKDGLRALEQGQQVEFSIQQTEKGEEARDVTVLQDGDFENSQQETTSTTNPGERQTGTVKKWIPGRGYGFLQRDNGGSDVFVHLRNLSDGIESLEEGQQVEFDLTKSEKGEIAQNVTVRSEK